jgi:ATP-dependent Lon protease
MNKPILFTRGVVVFPGANVNIEVGRTKSVNSINLANAADKKIVIASQRDPQQETPAFADIFNIGTLCEITSCEKIEDGSLKVVVKGIKRVKITAFKELDDAILANYELLKETNSLNKENVEKMNLLFSMMTKAFGTFSEKEIESLKSLVTGTPSASKIIDRIAGLIPISTNAKQAILSELNVTKRIDIIIGLASNEDDKTKIDRDISKKINDTLSKQQKEFYLREKMRVVKEELGELNSRENDANNLRKRVEENPYPENIKARVLSEISRMESNMNSQENSMTRSYIEWLLDLP